MSESADKKPAEAKPAKAGKPAKAAKAVKAEGGEECIPVPPSGGRPQRRPREKTCYNCGQSGHIARDCENARLEGDDRQVINKARAQYRRCFNCGRMGHISADCTKPAGNKACYNCGQEGHIAKDCPNPKAE